MVNRIRVNSIPSISTNVLICLSLLASHLRLLVALRFRTSHLIVALSQKTYYLAYKLPRYSIAQLRSSGH